MDAMEVFWKLEGIGLFARVSNDFEWAEIFVCEFLGRSGGTDVIRFYEDMITNVDDWRSEVLSVSWSLIAGLGSCNLLF